MGDLLLIIYILFWPVFYFFYAKYLLKMGPIFWSEYLQTEEGQKQIRNILDKEESSVIESIAEYCTQKIADWYNGKLGAAYQQIEANSPELNIQKKLKKEHWAVQMVAEKLFNKFSGDMIGLGEGDKEAIKEYQAGLK